MLRNSGGATDPGDGVGPVTGITISGDTTVQAGKTIQLTATLAPAGATEAVTWASDKPEVATVGGGLVTGLSAGTAKITATAGTISESVDVTVTGSTVKTVSRFEIKDSDTTLLPAGYQGQLPDLSGLTGTIWWSDGTVSDLKGDLRAQGFTTKPAVFSATQGDVTATTTSVFIFNKARPEVGVTMYTPGVHPFVATPTDLTPDTGVTYASLKTAWSGNVLGLRLATGAIATWYEDEEEPDLSGVQLYGYYQNFATTATDPKFQEVKRFNLGPEYIFTNYHTGIGGATPASSPAPRAYNATTDKRYAYGVQPWARGATAEAVINIQIDEGTTPGDVKYYRLPVTSYYWVRGIEAEPITWKNPDSDAKDKPYWYVDNVVNNKPGTAGLPSNAPAVADRITYWTNTLLDSGIQVRVYYEGTDGAQPESKLRNTDYVRRAVILNYAGIENPSGQNEGAGLPDFTQIEEGDDAVYLKFTYYPSLLTGDKITTAEYPNIANLTVPLATFNEEIDFVRRTKTAVERPVQFSASRPDTGLWFQTIRDTWKLVGIYTAPNGGGRVERDIADSKWATEANGAVRITNWADISTYDEATPGNVTLEAAVTWTDTGLGARSGNIMYGSVYNGTENSSALVVEAQR